MGNDNVLSNYIKFLIMKKNSIIQLVALVILIAIFIYLLINAINKSHPPIVSKNSIVIETPVTAPVNPVSTAVTATVLKEETKEVDSSEKILTGILWDKNIPKVIIKHTIVKIGDTIDDKKVICINEDSVILNDGTKDLELKL